MVMITSCLWFEYEQESNHISRQRRNDFLEPARTLERRSQRSVGGSTGSGVINALGWNKGTDHGTSAI